MRDRENVGMQKGTYVDFAEKMLDKLSVRRFAIMFMFLPGNKN